MGALPKPQDARELALDVHEVALQAGVRTLDDLAATHGDAPRRRPERHLREPSRASAHPKQPMDTLLVTPLDVCPVRTTGGAVIPPSIYGSPRTDQTCPAGSLSDAAR
jgi:hypothetical protein